MAASSRKNWQVFFGVILALGALTIAWLASAPVIDERITFALRRSANLAYVVFLLIFVARPLQHLQRKPWTAALLRKRRLLGVAFVGVMTVHLGLIAYRFSSQPQLEFDSTGSIPGMLVYSVFYLMLITSFDGPTRAIGRRNWKILHWIGLLAAAAAFAAPSSLDDFGKPDYLAVALPFAAVLLIRVTAWLQSRRPDSRRSAA